MPSNFANCTSRPTCRSSSRFFHSWPTNVNRVLGLALIGLAAAACLNGWQYSWIGRLIASHFAVSFTLVGIAYFGVLPSIYAKRSDGIRPLWNQLLLLPHSLLAALSFRISTRMVNEPAIAQLEPNIYFGRRLLNHEAVPGLDAGWIGVLDLAGEFAEAAGLRSLPDYQSFPILDGSAPSLKQLDAATKWLLETSQRGPVYVHCALGHGRTATVLAAYLLKTGSATTIDEGLARLRTLRSGVSLNRAQRRTLEKWAAERDSFRN